MATMKSRSPPPPPPAAADKQQAGPSRSAGGRSVEVVRPCFYCETPANPQMKELDWAHNSPVLYPLYYFVLRDMDEPKSNTVYWNNLIDKVIHNLGTKDASNWFYLCSSCFALVKQSYDLSLKVIGVKDQILLSKYDLAKEVESREDIL